MSKSTRRGYVPSDEKEFSQTQLPLLKKASEELFYLMNRGFPVKGASTFIGNHYMLSERQRSALTRTVSSESDLLLRREKEITPCLDTCRNSTIHIDGFNTIITLEVLLSGSLVLKCMDGSVRDLAGLRGNYHIIGKTQIAVNLLLNYLVELQVKEANIYLDSPVSNSGRLKTLIAELAQLYRLKVNIEVIPNVDSVLEELPYVVTSDAIILNRCNSWLNLTYEIISKRCLESWIVEIGYQ